MEKYIEDEKSKIICELQRNRNLLLFCPICFWGSNKINKLFILLSYYLKHIYHRLFKRNLYDVDYLYDFDKEISYDKNLRKVKTVVYTCVIGEYDTIKEPLYVNSNVDYVVVTDLDVKENSSWRKIDISKLNIPENLSASQKNRYVKMHPHLIFPDYEYSVYIDGSIRLMADIMPMVYDMEYKCFLGMHKHPVRRRISTEMNAVIYCKKIADKDVLKKQVFEYYKQGYDDAYGILEGTLIIRKHNMLDCVNLMSDWWKEMEKYPTRDQISLPYILWKRKISREVIHIFPDCVFTNPRIRWEKHLK